MPDTSITARMREQFPDIPIITFNSDEWATPAAHTDGSSPTDSLSSALNTLKTSSSSASITEDLPGKCASCHKVAAMTCKDCKDLPTKHGSGCSSTYYCSRDCQREHWKVHKQDCKAAKARRTIYRSANLIKALFYIYQETTFHWAYFTEIQKHGHLRIVFIDKPKSDVRKTMLVPFSTVTDLVSDPHEQEAFLTHLSCNEAVARFSSMLTGMLKGACG